MSPWSALDQIPGGRAVAWVWQRHLGEQFDAFAGAFLQPAARPVRFYPCPHECGCAHEIIAHGPDDLVAVCRCASWNCDDFAVSGQEIFPLELGWPRLGRAVVKAFELDSKPAPIIHPDTRQIGSWSADAVPVLLTLAPSAAEVRRVLLELAARLRRRFILFTPTARHLDVAIQELLAQVNAACFSLEAHLTLTPNGTLHTAKAPGELFASFTPAAPPDEQDVARRAFNLVQQLDSEKLTRPPSLLAVFRAYCMDELSVNQAARKLHCSKPTVLRRLQLLRRKTGLAPQALRRFSPHLARLDHDLTDSRAAHLHRRSAIYDADGEE